MMKQALDKDLLNRIDEFLKEKKDILDQIEKFYDEKVEKKMKNGVDKIEKILTKEIRLGDGKLISYDEDSPLSYIAAFMKDKGVSSVMPSSKFIVRRVIKAMNLSKIKTVVEFGPAEGVITKEILDRLGPDGKIIAIELNGNFVKALKKNITDPRLIAVEGDVQDVEAIMKKHGLEGVDAIVSGIPFSFFNSRERHLLLEKILGRLNPKGRFVAYQFTTHLIPLLKCYFSKVDTQLEVRNLPPHFVFTCHK
jgi:phospholipid N-methyltransferase